MKKYIAVFIILLTFTSSDAQELKCQVQINAQKINGVDQRVFQSMQTAVNEFMNTRVWTQDVFSPEEKIDCNFFVNLETNPSQDVYTATITVQSSRPSYNSTYNSPVLNFKDADFVFTYTENTPLEFNVNQYNSNLTSVLGYYAYLIIALDYETMSKGGGAKYFTTVETITNLVPQNASDAKGWKPFDGGAISGNRNRYNIINSLQGGKYEGFKQALYEYHFKGMDNFYENPTAARQSVLNALDKLDKTFRDNPNNVLITLLMQAKSDELIGIFSGAEQGDKIKAVTVLKRIDPSNASKYDKIIRG